MNTMQKVYLDAQEACGIDRLLTRKWFMKNDKFPVITLCGSTRFPECFEKWQRELTLAGYIVISVGLFGHREENFDMSGKTKKMLDRMHFQKIYMADTIYVLNKDGYIGLSTWDEILYAISIGKNVVFIEPLRNECAVDLVNLCGFEYPANWIIWYSDTIQNPGLKSLQYNGEKIVKTDPEKAYAFVDSKCPVCNGTGWVEVAPNCRGVKMCGYCRSTGLVGEYKEFPRIDLPPENPFGLKLRKFREKRQVSMSLLANLLGCSVSHFSEIERGLVQATEDEKIKISEWILSAVDDE